MIRYIRGSGFFDHDRLGQVRFVVRSTARRFVARWKGGILHLTVPPMATVADLDNAVRQMLPRLLARKPRKSLYEINREMVFGSFSVVIVGKPAYGHRCTLHETSHRRFEIRIDISADMESPDVTAAISRMMKRLAAYVAPHILFPQAGAVAARVGVKPAEWQLSSGRKVLGRCNSRGVIALSSVLVFLPEELREYVICHELAHLDEMNHSPRFHALCDKYCRGRERQLEAALKAAVIPIV